KAIAITQNLPLIGINHIEAHIYANWLDTIGSYDFPLLCLIVSGGHSDLILMSDHGNYTILGQTRDDAAGEAFDKVARILQLGYPGGPAIETAALRGNANAYNLPRAQLRGSLDFSFSGLKTATLHLFEETSKAKAYNPQIIADIAASFQQAVVDALATKTILAAEKYHVRLILLAGGVASNQALRKAIIQKAKVPVGYPHPKHCTDNAAMVASCGYFHFRSNKIDGLDLDVVSGLRLGDN
ncbi:MAG: tRNA (adenosine(37)-N6)-threonylcarbamoyltransferase complex transferase subunit TsaD, partial [Chloroflexota bacterium]|nr:tRNA (adenosine(37)-N6)-threonylcarbamoyltransferase complex transferase subunit TsaD [Chloroflexota bacterium]